MQIRKVRGVHGYRIYLTKEELLQVAHDHSLSDWFYVNQLRELIGREASKLDITPRESGKGEPEVRG